MASHQENHWAWPLARLVCWEAPRWVFWVARWRNRQVGALTLTAAPLAIGGIVLLPIALATEGAPRLDLSGAAIIIWLAIVNTALVYFLYNHLLQTRAAFEVGAL